MDDLRPWPDDWPKYKQHHASSACDMVIGPCRCGAWHEPGEFELVDGHLHRYSTREAAEAAKEE